MNKKIEQIKRLIDNWNTFWYQKVPPHGLAVFRIFFGLYLFVEALTYYVHTPAMFSAHALTFSLWSPSVPEALQFLLEPPSAEVAWGIATVFLIASLMLSAGFFMSSALIVLVLLYMYYWQLSFHSFISSYHRIYLVILLVFLISGADKTLSLRMRIQRGSFFAWEPVSIFPQRLLCVQMTFTYLGVGLQKLHLPDWQDGRALSFSLMNRWATPLGRWVIDRGYPYWGYDISVHLITYGEFFLGVGLWLKNWRVFFVFVGALFHIGIAVLMSIWWFIALIPAYVLFFPPQDVQVFVEKRLGKSCKGEKVKRCKGAKEMKSCNVAQLHS